MNLPTRIEEKIEYEPMSGCWLWTGAMRGKYKDRGCVSWEGRMQTVARVVWGLLCGDIPEGVHVLHRCDNPACVNPGHLYLGTNKDNVSDRERRRRSDYKWLVGERNTNAKLTVEQVRSIKQSSQKNIRLAEEVNVDPALITHIKKNKIWKHVQV